MPPQNPWDFAYQPPETIQGLNIDPNAIMIPPARPPITAPTGSPDYFRQRGDQIQSDNQRQQQIQGWNQRVENAMAMDRTPETLYQPISPAPSPIQQALETEARAASGRLQRLETPPTPWSQLGVGGKIGRVFSTIGNIAGDVIAPATMMNIPGTQLHRQVEIAGLRGELGDIGTLQARQAEATAREATAQAELARAQRETKGTLEWTKRGLVSIGSDNKATLVTDENGQPLEQVEKPGKESTNEEWDAYQDLVTGDNGKPRINPVTGQPYTPLEALQQVKQAGAAAKAQPEKEKDISDYLEANKLPDTAANRERARAAIAARGRQEPGNYQPVPDPNNPANIIGWVDPKSRHFVPATGVPGMPTAGGTIPTKLSAQEIRTADQAGIAADAVPGVIAEIQANRDKLGPIMGRWNDFYQGKLGAEADQFAGLRADLVFLSSAVTLAHSIGRMPENLRLEFDAMINAPKQNPENIIKVLEKTQQWMQRLRNIRGTPGAGGGPSPPSTTRPNATPTNRLGLPGF